MYITFLSSHRMSEDGFEIKLFEADNTYDVADSCACSALRQGWAELAQTDNLLAFLDKEFNLKSAI